MPLNGYFQRRVSRAALNHNRRVQAGRITRKMLMTRRKEKLYYLFIVFDIFNKPENYKTFEYGFDKISAFQKESFGADFGTFHLLRFGGRSFQ